jgi:cytochrome c-type biogenesis protein
LAFSAGALTFISPCVFPLYPAFLSYITGMSVAEIQMGELKGQRKAIFHRVFFLFGFSIIYLVLGFGWTPCMGPILAATLALVGANPSQGLWYMAAYVLGFSIPFLLMAFFITKFAWLKKYSGSVMKVGGGIMIAMGMILFMIN